MIFPTKKYKIIYADPAWDWKTWSEKGDGRSASQHYNVSSLDKMMLLPIEKIAEKDSVLLMWATYPNLEKAFELGKAWGFTYKTVAFVWAKKNKLKDSFFTGMGYYTRANTEPVLLFTKGNPLKRINKSVKQLCISKIMEHSRKPDEIRYRIVDLFGDLPRIELFARQEYKGWDCWGDEENKQCNLF